MKTKFSVVFNTQTMIFENSYEAHKFFEKFHDRIPKFLDLQKKNLQINFTIEPNSKMLIFTWLFETRDLYLYFIEEMKKTEFYEMTGHFGWKLIHKGSSQL